MRVFQRIDRLSNTWSPSYGKSVFSSDDVHAKQLIHLYGVCELTHCSLICYSTYIVLINNYGNLASLATLPLPLSIAVGFSGIIEPLVQAFFAYRVFVVSNKILIPAICWILTTVRSALTFTAMGVSIKSSNVTQFHTKYEWLFGSLLGVSIATDVIVSMSLFNRLRHRYPGQQSITPPPPLIDKMIAWTIQSGLVSAITEIAMFITFYALKDSYIWVAIYLSLSKIFSISLLASLNGRMVLPEKNTFALRQTQHFTNPITFPSTSTDPAGSEKNDKGLTAHETASQDIIQYVEKEKQNTSLPDDL
ncbi:hypothetical protein CPB84DRAFT_1968238 [Gymnopilus junonius]|uniref:DUF6534 domain-containing protein n=1 Tax=Gymnopilus junonius TaxID=109634 RepID=A0A9P5N8G2_GYMJU|nr:hypothetical protein CPB84DRAFT_1968238 [Gymnopilus junonius]